METPEIQCVSIHFIFKYLQIVSVHISANCFDGAKAQQETIPTWRKCGKHTECQDESDGFLGVQSSNPKENTMGKDGYAVAM